MSKLMTFFPGAIAAWVHLHFKSQPVFTVLHLATSETGCARRPARGDQLELACGTIKDGDQSLIL